MKNQIASIFLAGAFSAVATSSFAATEIQWWHAMDGASKIVLEDITTQFNDSQSEYKVKPVFKGGYVETVTSTIAAFRAKKQPEISMVYVGADATLMNSKGAFIPVEDLMKKYDRKLDKSDFHPVVRQFTENREGKMLSLAFNMSTPLLWYNKDAFEKVGIEKVPTNWSEMDAVSAKFRKAGYECGYSVGWQTWVFINNYAGWNDIQIAKRNEKDRFVKEFTLNNPKLTNRLQAIKDSGNFVYGGRQSKSLPMFLNQKCPMWLNSPAYYGYLSKVAKFKLGMSKLPYDDAFRSKPQVSTLGGASLWVLSGHSDKKYEATAAFLEFVNQPKIQAQWHQGTGNIPITKSAYELTIKQGYYKEHPGLDVALKQLTENATTENTRTLSYLGSIKEGNTFEAELENIWSGKKTAVEAMKDANDKLNKVLEGNK